MSLQDFTNSYITCALWASNDNDDTPLDQNYSEEDIGHGTRLAMEADCKDFYEANNHLWQDYPRREDYSPDARAGHDFWLTRNRHGAGFWDRGLEHGDQLTKLAHAFGEFHLFIGDHGTIDGSKG